MGGGGGGVDLDVQLTLNGDKRDLKQGRRGRLRERNKFAYSVGKNNSFARPARAFHILIHFFAVLVLTTT